MTWGDVRWILQRNLGNAHDLRAMTDALDGLGVEWEGIDVRPFDDTPPAVSTEGRVLFYGATSLISTVARACTWKPGVFFDPDRFSFEALRDGYGTELLNHDSQVFTVAELVEQSFPADRVFFVRPAADLKEFSGETMSFAQIQHWKGALAGTHGPMSLATRVQIAEPRLIDREWRVIMVGGRAVTASRYRTHGQLDPSSDVPGEVTVYAERMAARWQPAPVFTLDVCDSEDTLRVVETNCFHSSGFYRCDIRAALRAVTAWVIRNVEISQERSTNART